jgi:hypothetical protein
LKPAGVCFGQDLSGHKAPEESRFCDEITFSVVHSDCIWKTAMNGMAMIDWEMFSEETITDDLQRGLPGFSPLAGAHRPPP